MLRSATGAVSAMRSNYRSHDDLSGYLSKAGVPGIEGIDTRALTRKLRSSGVMRGVLACSEASAKQSDADLTGIIEKGKKPMPGYEGKLTKDQISDVVKYLRTLK